MLKKMSTCLSVVTFHVTVSDNLAIHATHNNSAVFLI
jgi:hypothetical protein